MITIDIPNFGQLALEHLVADFSGTLWVDGILIDGVKDRLNALSQKLEIHILTADTHGKAKEQLSGINGTIHILNDGNHSQIKADYIKQLGADNCVAVGNGNNDVLMLKTARIGIVVCTNEGCSTDALQSSDILVTSPLDALDLLIYPNRLIATLRK